jgi:hypothetical protein
MKPRPSSRHSPLAEGGWAARRAAFGILSRGEVSEWLMVPLSKSGVRKHRGFESRPLRHPLIGLTAPGRVCALRSSLTHHRVRSLWCSVASLPGTAIPTSGVLSGGAT